MFCQKCGTQISDDSAFCASCGAAQGAAEKPAEVQTPAAPEAPVASKPVRVETPIDFNAVMKSPKYHQALKTFGLFVAAGVMALFAILLFTGCQYGGMSMMGYSISYSSALYSANAFILVLDILFGVVLLAGALAQVFFWAQFTGNNLGFLPMLEKAQVLSLFRLVNLIVAAVSAGYFLINGICVVASSEGNMSFLAPWIGALMLLLTGAYFGFNYLYYKGRVDLLD